MTHCRIIQYEHNCQGFLGFLSSCDIAQRGTSNWLFGAMYFHHMKRQRKQWRVIASLFNSNWIALSNSKIDPHKTIFVLHNTRSLKAVTYSVIKEISHSSHLSAFCCIKKHTAKVFNQSSVPVPLEQLYSVHIEHMKAWGLRKKHFLEASAPLDCVCHWDESGSDERLPTWVFRSTCCELL